MAHLLTRMEEETLYTIYFCNKIDCRSLNSPMCLIICQTDAAIDTASIYIFPVVLSTRPLLTY